MSGTGKQFWGITHSLCYVNAKFMIQKYFLITSTEIVIDIKKKPVTALKYLLDSHMQN